MNHRHLNKDGVGLGLVLSKNIAMALGGDIYIKSEINRGSKFYLVLPFTEETILQRNTSMN